MKTIQTNNASWTRTNDGKIKVIFFSGSKVLKEVSIPVKEFFMAAEALRGEVK